MLFFKLFSSIVTIAMLVNAQQSSQNRLPAVRTIPIRGPIVSQYRRHKPMDVTLNDETTESPKIEDKSIMRKMSTDEDANGYEAVPNKCNSYIEYRNNITNEKKCSDGFYFDDTVAYPNYPCNYALQVNCKNQSDLEKSEPSTIFPSTAVSSSSYSESYTTPSASTISSSTISVSGLNASTSKPAIDQSSKDLSQNEEQSNKCKRENGYEAVPNNCDSYIICQNNTFNQTRCPEGFYFEAAVVYPNYPCNYALQVNCQKQTDKSAANSSSATNSESNATRSSSTISPSTISVSDTTNASTSKPAPVDENNEDSSIKKEQSNKCKRENGYEAVPNNCDSYIICQNNTFNQTKCPDGFYFDAAVVYPNYPCNYALQVNCQSQSAEDSSFNKEQLYKCKSENGYEVVPNKCDSYIICQNNTFNQTKCSDGFYFDASVLYPNYPCNYASRVNCQIQSNTETSQSATTSPPTASSVSIQSSTISSLSTNSDSNISTSTIPHSTVPVSSTTNATTPKPMELTIPGNKEDFSNNKNQLNNNKPENGYEAVPNKCESYNIRQNNTLNETKCPEGFYFDTTVLYPNYPCNYAKRVNCQIQSDADKIQPATISPLTASSITSSDTTNGTTPKPTKSTIDENNEDKRGNSYEAVPNKCDSYITRQNNTLNETKCSDGLYFDAAVKFPDYPCNYLAQVKCQSQLDIEEIQPSTVSPSINAPNSSSLSTTTSETSSPSTPSSKLTEISSPSTSSASPGTNITSNPIQLKTNETDDVSSNNDSEKSQGDRTKRSPVCSMQNMYVKINGQCDSYLECVNYTSVNMQCPDGLHFNSLASWPEYPCDYPHIVQCADGDEPQPAVPTTECSHQYGYMISPKAIENDCGHYQVCIGGKAIDMYCPPGLAFNSDKAVCDWPSDVSTCNTKAYIGFTCPLATFVGGFPVITNHAYSDDCFAFYSCMNGQARILSCDPGFAFNPDTAHCEDEQYVSCDDRHIPSRTV